jgi:hypothetical protein
MFSIGEFAQHGRVSVRMLGDRASGGAAVWRPTSPTQVRSLT